MCFSQETLARVRRVLPAAQRTLFLSNPVLAVA